MDMQTKMVDNGVNVAALLGAREALEEMPEAAKFGWRTSCNWVNGTHSHCVVEDFSGLGEKHQHRSREDQEDQKSSQRGCCWFVVIWVVLHVVRVLCSGVAKLQG